MQADKCDKSVIAVQPQSLSSSSFSSRLVLCFPADHLSTLSPNMTHFMLPDASISVIDAT